MNQLNAMLVGFYNPLGGTTSHMFSEFSSSIKACLDALGDDETQTPPANCLACVTQAERKGHGVAGPIHYFPGHFYSYMLVITRG